MSDNKKDKVKVVKKISTNKKVGLNMASADKVKKIDKNVKADKKVKAIEVVAISKFVHISPRKARLVIDQLRGEKVVEVLGYIKFINKAATEPIIKLIKSAVANAENNFNLDKDDLYIKTITVDSGPTLKRWRPRAMGRSARIAKKTSHLRLVLSTGVDSKIKVGKTGKKEADKKEEIKVVNPKEIKKDSLNIGAKGVEQKGHDQKGFLKKVFNRKTG